MPGRSSKEYAQIIQWVDSQTDHLDGWTLSQRVWWLENRRNPQCPICGKPTKLSRNLPLVERACSMSCTAKRARPKRKATLRERYGVDHQMHIPEVAAKVGKAIASIPHDWSKGPSHLLSDTAAKKLYTEGWLHNEHIVLGRGAGEIAKSIEVTERTIYDHLKKNSIPLQKIKRSSYETEIQTWLESIGCVPQLNKHLSNIGELDLYLPDNKLGIEFDGLYWHSYASKETSQQKYKHQRKQVLSYKQGINLLQIFEHEWLHQKPIWQSIIRSNIRQTQTKIRASKCVVDHDVSVREQRDFLEKNHLQGYCPCSHAVGLRFNGDLVAMMTFGKPRFSSGFDWEIIRLCSLLNTTVHGGASRMLKKFRENHLGSIMTFHDTRHGSGNVYRKLGGTFERLTPPSYFYWKLNDTSKFISRYQAQKHKLPKLLGSDYDPAKSESENMFGAGYRRLWTSGNTVFTWA